MARRDWFQYPSGERRARSYPYEAAARTGPILPAVVVPVGAAAAEPVPPRAARRRLPGGRAGAHDGAALVCARTLENEFVRAHAVYFTVMYLVRGTGTFLRRCSTRAAGRSTCPSRSTSAARSGCSRCSRRARSPSPCTRPRPSAGPRPPTVRILVRPVHTSMRTCTSDVLASLTHSIHSHSRTYSCSLVLRLLRARGCDRLRGRHHLGARSRPLAPRRTHMHLLLHATLRPTSLASMINDTHMCTAGSVSVAHVQAGARAARTRLLPARMSHRGTLRIWLPS